MNPASLLFAAFVLALFAVLAAVTWWGAKKYGDWPLRKRQVVCGGFAVLGVLFSVFAYLTDSQQRAVTLFEVRLDWEEIPAEGWPVVVEHPGVEHRIRLLPKLPPLREAAEPVTLHVTLGTERGTPALDESIRFEVERDVSSRSSGSNRRVWESQSRTFRPRVAGRHTLRVEAEGGYPPQLFLRIEDPLKRDGKRAPGY